MSSSNQSPFNSPVVPVQLGPTDRFRFRCRKGIACFNKCCQNIDITLTPYDIVRMKTRLGLSSREFIDRYTRDCELDGQGLPGLKLATKPGTTECVHLTEEGCGVYTDRPAACRYYALGLISMRRKDSPTDEDSYFVVKEDHCLGHDEPVEQTVAEYRASQGCDEYDALNREWRQIILKKRSSGPTVGRPSTRSFELFFLASYDVDGFRAFVASEGFQSLFDMPAELLHEVMTDDVAMMRFGLRYLRQALFGEMSIALKPGPQRERLQRVYQKAKDADERARSISESHDQMYGNLE